MTKLFKGILYTAIALGLLVLIATIIANIVLKHKIENILAHKLPSHIHAAYDDLSVHALDGNIALSNIVITLKKESDSLPYGELRARGFAVEDISQWDFLINDRMYIGEIKLEQPRLHYYKNRVSSKKDSSDGKLNFHKPIWVKRLNIADAEIAVFQSGQDSVSLFTQGLVLHTANIRVNDSLLGQKIPFEYSNLSVEADTLFLQANDYDLLQAKRYSIRDRNILFNDVRYFTKYSRQALSKVRNKQRDHYDISLKSMSINDFTYGFKDTLFTAQSKRVLLQSPSADIYRDKLLPPQTKIKPLYSRSLRELPFALSVDSVRIENGFLRYEEKVQEDQRSGYIQFKNLNADIAQVGNTYSKKTDIKISALFMKSTPINVHWYFDVQEQSDQFIFKADVGALNAAEMNSFTEKNMGVKLEGEATQTYFTIDGNDEGAICDLKIRYSDFKVTVLQKDEKKKNHFLSAIVNIFVSKDSKGKEEVFSEGSGEVTRDKTKSVFNLLWISIKSALQKSMT